jgi:pyrophosphatase PpaX
VPLFTFLFDLDGTLIDSIELILRSYRHTMRVHGREVPSDDVWMQGLGTPLWVQFRQLTDDPSEIDAMVATYRAYNLAHHDELVRPYAGVVAAVRGLRRPGRALGLVTSKMRSGAVRGLKAAALASAFDVIVGAEEVTHPSPRARAAGPRAPRRAGRRRRVHRRLAPRPRVRARGGREDRSRIVGTV